ncbi:hypothetical protein CPB83DRAFT_831864 [Crepidotus variabilis]|uniref:Uncharacterized protein n=1 Tax=Crepidotus variabilis TaxID=179855 RepID=A0A9P6EQB3_9AGAR|nr:hypothetical protein CPB83DRAFT_831864 [Crepidotus variabilis]
MVHEDTMGVWRAELTASKVTTDEVLKLSSGFSGDARVNDQRKTSTWRGGDRRIESHYYALTDTPAVQFPTSYTILICSRKLFDLPQPSSGHRRIMTRGRQV